MAGATLDLLYQLLSFRRSQIILPANSGACVNDLTRLATRKRVDQESNLSVYCAEQRHRNHNHHEFMKIFYSP